MKTKPDTTGWPGPVIRRLQQIAVLVFHRETEGHELTPTQFGTLLAVGNQPGLDQVRVSQITRIDRSMTARVVETLARRGLLQKEPGRNDKRANALFLTPRGEQLVKRVFPYVKKAQAEILRPLSAADRVEFLRMSGIILEAYEKEAGESAGDEEAAPKRRGRRPKS
jgi:DNA-binding MarR family transcriptional regulator